MRHLGRCTKKQLLVVATTLLLCVGACGEDASVSGINEGDDEILGGTHGKNVLLEPRIRTMTLRPAPNPDRNAYFGDLHVHTEYSFDAFAFGSLATPGMPTGSPAAKRSPTPRATSSS